MTGGGSWREPLRLVALVGLPLVAAAVASVLWLSRRHAPEPGLAWDDDARREIQGWVEGRYVDPITPERSERLFDAAMKGYVHDLDDFSRYYPRSERTALDEETAGAFGGIGVRVAAAPAGLLVVAVRRDGPADAAGVAPGDVIEKVGDEPLAGRDHERSLELIKGPPDSRVDLWVRRAGELRKIEATRARVESDTVPASRMFEGDPAVGYLRLAQFSETTPSEAADALSRLLARGAKALVLDLRENLGGVVTAAAEIAGLFLPRDSVVAITRMREGADAYRTDEKTEPLAPDLPLVVLVDENTASASEILAGALADHGRALLVGERTWGKFLMQTILPLSHRDAKLKITTSRYETPRGRSDPRDAAHGRTGGLLPDVRVPLRTDDERDALRIEFARQAGEMWRVLPERDVSKDAPDPQLKAALDLLRGLAPPAEPIPPRAE